MDDIDRSGMGTAADFSGWSGLNTNGIKSFKEIEATQKKRTLQSKVDLSKLMTTPKESELEMKNIALHFMPTIDKIDEENYDTLCNRAIDFAFKFNDIWRKEWEKHLEEKQKEEA